MPTYLNPRSTRILEGEIRILEALGEDDLCVGRRRRQDEERYRHGGERQYGSGSVSCSHYLSC